VRNEAVAKLEGLVGVWELTLTDAWFLDRLDVRVSGTATFEWLDDAFIVWRWSLGGPDVDEPVEIVMGYSDAQQAYMALYHDHRGVSRVFGMTWDGERWTLLREDPDFHQRFVATVESDRILARFDASEDQGGTWRKDFDLIFERPAKR
jgi:hypothetical protein